MQQHRRAPVPGLQESEDCAPDRLWQLRKRLRGLCAGLSDFGGRACPIDHRQQPVSAGALALPVQTNAKERV